MTRMTHSLRAALLRDCLAIEPRPGPQDERTAGYFTHSIPGPEGGARQHLRLKQVRLSSYSTLLVRGYVPLCSDSPVAGCCGSIGIYSDVFRGHFSCAHRAQEKRAMETRLLARRKC